MKWSNFYTLSLFLLFASCKKNDEGNSFNIGSRNILPYALNFYYFETSIGMARGESIIHEMTFYITDGDYQVSDGNSIGFMAGPMDFHVTILATTNGNTFGGGDYYISDHFKCEEDEPNFAEILLKWELDQEYDYAGQSGKIKVTRRGDKFAFAIQGIVYDKVDVHAGHLRENGWPCPAPFPVADLKGKFSANFIQILSFEKP
jgi:hypothetical protein